MGGRGASSGVSDKGKPYGSEYNQIQAMQLLHLKL